MHSHAYEPLLIRWIVGADGNDTGVERKEDDDGTMRRWTTGRRQANGPGRVDDKTMASSHTPCACCARAFF